VKPSVTAARPALSADGSGASSGTVSPIPRRARRASIAALRAIRNSQASGCSIGADRP